jgi:hypothetical protein
MERSFWGLHSRDTSLIKPALRQMRRLQAISGEQASTVARPQIRHFRADRPFGSEAEMARWLMERIAAMGNFEIDREVGDPVGDDAI